MTVQEYAVKLRSNISKIIKGKDDKIDPVSYTHLDVYKRQLLQRIKTLIVEQIIFPTHTKLSAITFCQGGEIICLFVK